MAGLADVSAEVMELIIALLDFPAMCNMRLVSRDVSAKATHGVVKSDFLDPIVDWTGGGQMQALVTKTAKGWTGCLMKQLTVVGIVEPDTMDPRGSLPIAAPTKEGEASFVQAFANIQRHSPRGYLNALALRVQRSTHDGPVQDSSSIRQVGVTWDASAQTFAATMRALVASRMSIQRLNLFGPDSPRCALACNSLADVLAILDKSLQCSLRTLTHLTIGLSDAVATQWSGGLSLEQQPAHALLRMVLCCPSLTNLDIRWYNLGASRLADQQQQSESAESTITSQLVGTSTGRASLQRLHESGLRGVYTTEAALLAYLESTTHLRILSLEEIHLSEGTFGPIFRFLSSKPSTLNDLQQVYLNDLWEGESHLRFFARGEPHFPSTGVAKPHAMTWLASPSSKPIKYLRSQGRASGSAAFNNWRRRRVKAYGPPDARV